MSIAATNKGFIYKIKNSDLSFKLQSENHIDAI